jgi:hypothetical protein
VPLPGRAEARVPERPNLADRVVLYGVCGRCDMLSWACRWQNHDFPLIGNTHTALARIRPMLRQQRVGQLPARPATTHNVFDHPDFTDGPCTQLLAALQRLLQRVNLSAHENKPKCHRTGAHAQTARECSGQVVAASECAQTTRRTSGTSAPTGQPLVALFQWPSKKTAVKLPAADTLPCSFVISMWLLLVKAMRKIPHRTPNNFPTSDSQRQVCLGTCWRANRQSPRLLCLTVTGVVPPRTSVNSDNDDSQMQPLATLCVCLHLPCKRTLPRSTTVALRCQPRRCSR